MHIGNSEQGAFFVFCFECEKQGLIVFAKWFIN